MNKMTREQVYQAIDSEREYQDKRWPPNEHQHSILEFIVYIEHYVDEIKKLCSTLPDDLSNRSVKDNTRKIAGLAVAALEQHGCDNRYKSLIPDAVIKEVTGKRCERKPFTPIENPNQFKDLGHIYCDDKDTI